MDKTQYPLIGFDKRFSLASSITRFSGDPLTSSSKLSARFLDVAVQNLFSLMLELRTQRKNDLQEYDKKFFGFSPVKLIGSKEKGFDYSPDENLRLEVRTINGDSDSRRVPFLYKSTQKGILMLTYRIGELGCKVYDGRTGGDSNSLFPVAIQVPPMPWMGSSQYQAETVKAIKTLRKERNV